MKFSKYLGYFFIFIGLCAAVATAWVSAKNINAEPVLLKSPEAAKLRVTGMMDAFCAGDYAAAEKVLLGDTRLGVDRDAADPVGQLIWDTFRSSMTYELLGQQYATNKGLAQNIRITTIDMKALTDYIEANTKILLEKRVNERLDAKEGLDEIYDENDEYRDEFVAQILMETAQQAIKQETATITTELTLSLSWVDGKWWIEPNEQLLGAVSGGIVG